jgi:hypothetical protein
MSVEREASNGCDIDSFETLIYNATPAASE